MKKVMMIGAPCVLVSLLLAGCPKDDVELSTPDTEPTPAPTLAPGEPTDVPGPLGDQKSIIASLQPLGVKRGAMRDVENDRLRVYYNGKLLVTGMATSEASGGELLVPIRTFYAAYDDHTARSTVVYWVKEKRRILVAKRPISKQITIINDVGYTWPSEIAERHDWNVLTNYNYGEIEFETP